MSDALNRRDLGLPAREGEGDKTGWLIERYHMGTLRYWNGRPLDSASVAHRDARDLDAGAWTEKATDAIWFSDEESATGVLAWCCGGVGRAVMHMVIQKAQPHE